MAERLPPLNALKAFEAAARQASFSKAARELNVSPAAISHQVKNLEDFLGVQLFHRMNRSLKLSDAGQAALPLLRDGFGRLAEAVRQLREHDGRSVLNVWAPPSFAAKWLLPRLSRYGALRPEITIQLSASDSLIGAAAGEGQTREDADLAVRFGLGDAEAAAGQGLRVDRLLTASVLPLCSPRLLRDGPALNTPADLAHHTLLHDDTDYPGRPDWRDWLAAADAGRVDGARGPRFNHSALALEAAAEGHGVALTLLPLARADIAAGRLVAPFDISLPLRSAYWLSGAAPEAAETAAFRQWLLAEAQAESATGASHAM